MPKLSICASSPRKDILPFSNSKSVSPTTRYLNYFLSSKETWIFKQKRSRHLCKSKWTYNQYQRCKSIKKERAWSSGNLTCTGEQWSMLSPTPTCPNCVNIGKKQAKSTNHIPDMMKQNKQLYDVITFSYIRKRNFNNQNMEQSIRSVKSKAYNSK